MFAKTFRTGLRLASTLAFVEHHASKVAPASLSALTAAKNLGHPVTAVLLGQSAPALAPEVAKYDGVEKVFVFKSDSDHVLSESAAQILADTVRSQNFSHLLAAGSSSGKDILPRAGGLLDSQPISEVIEIKSDSEFVHPVYAGNALETVKTAQPVKVLTVRASAFPAIGESGEASVEEKDLAFSGRSSEFVREELSKSERPELGSAARVVSGGFGLKSKENFDKLILPLADKIGAAVGGSRAAVDNGFCDNSLQVGQTGKVVAPDVYIAVGISGAIQHLAGMKDAKVIAAIDKNEDAPIFQIADIGLKADLFEAVPEITEKI